MLERIAYAFWTALGNYLIAKGSPLIRRHLEKQEYIERGREYSEKIKDPNETYEDRRSATDNLLR